MSRCSSCGAHGLGVLPPGSSLCGHCTRAAIAGPAGSKRRREEVAMPSDFFDDAAASRAAAPSARAGAGAGTGAGDELTEEEIAAMLAAAEAEASAEVASLDPIGVKKLLLGLEKRVTKNQLARAKFGDQPARFLESEMELDEELKGLRVLAAAPELYPLLSASDSLRTLLSLLSHENVDIACDVVALLSELTDEDAIGSREEAEAAEEAEAEAAAAAAAEAAAAGETAAASVSQDPRSRNFRAGAALVEALEACDGCELLVSHMGRLTEGSGGGDEDGQGLYATLGLLQNMVEAVPRLALALVSGVPGATGAPSSAASAASSSAAASSSVGARPSPLLAHLLRTLRDPRAAFDANKLAASELLAVLLSSDAGVAGALGGCSFALAAPAGGGGGGGGGGGSGGRAGRLRQVDGVEYLLEVCNVYRRREPASLDERECVGNLFGALASALVRCPANVPRFLAAEGPELMLRIVSAGGAARLGALRALAFCLSAAPGGAAPSAAGAFVAAGGLKALGPALAGAAAAATRRLHGPEGELEESAAARSITLSLLSHLPPAALEGAGAARTRLLRKFAPELPGAPPGEGDRRIARLLELFLAEEEAVAAAEAAALAEEAEEEEEEEEEGGEAGAEARRRETEAKQERIYLRRLQGGLPDLQRLALVLAALAVDGTGALAAAGEAAPAPAPAVAALAGDVAVALTAKAHEQGASLTAMAMLLQELCQRAAAGDAMAQYARRLMPALQAAAGGTGEGV